MVCTNKEKIDELKKYMDEVMRNPYPESYLIAVLHKAQELYGYLDREIMDLVSETMSIPTAKIWGVATFYHFFNLKPQGKHSIFVCLGTACHIKGSGEILDLIRTKLNIEIGETTPDGFFTLRETRCLGACGLAPVVMIDDKIYGNLTRDKMISILDGFKRK
ncbi:MAG: NAD(P)H-dependent oxidoreductase subunit E [Candidatus Omnitrophica bacterium]|nr:NAD(P)H-dependent oxidoreductase subunit E [Candidatus Omnitrophota bacterium]MDD5081167.1 NAD(P)H-dependent oxidoreductase subunit E [Candidatus Omnitrophota bacterium]MDD5440924.1 NAD(P)H-dependent oxidoreductase subunit E [Candidatus Omnitrophota bacterium]